jgi:hypothetical protein
MRIDIDDDNQNWLNWGTLVVAWINGNQTPPVTVQQLRQQMAASNVSGQVQGADNRVVSVAPYSDSTTDALIINIPSQKMLQAKLSGVTSGPYPTDVMPLFFDIAYGGAARPNLSAQQSLEFAYRRIGEYTVNECC